MSTHSYGRNVTAALIRDLVAAGADDRNKLYAALRAHFANTSLPWNKGKLATIDAWARLAADSGAINLVAVGERPKYRAPASSGAPTLTTYRYIANPLADVHPPAKCRLRQATWGKDATASTIWQAVSDGATNRFALALWINALLDGVCHPIRPIKAEQWAMYACKAGAIRRIPQQAGEEPYIHRPGEYRARFHRFEPAKLPEPEPEAPHGIDSCTAIFEHFNLIPTAVPPCGVGRVHLWDIELEDEAA